MSKQKIKTKRSSQNKHNNDIRAGYARRMLQLAFAQKWKSRGE